MTPPTLVSRKALLAVLLAGTMALTVGACGRRGRPEPPPNPNAAKTQPTADKSGKVAAAKAKATDDDDDDDEDEQDKGQPVIVSPQPSAPGRKKVKPFEVPRQPFILDSLL